MGASTAASPRAADEALPEEAEPVESARLLRLQGSADQPADGGGGAGVLAGRSGVAHGLKVVVYCAAYLAIGPTLILVNRSLLKEHHFNYPMALSGLGLLFSSAVSFCLVRCCAAVSLPHAELVRQRSRRRRCPSEYLTQMKALPVGQSVSRHSFA